MHMFDFVLGRHRLKENGFAGLFAFRIRANSGGIRLSPHPLYVETNQVISSE
jgi:hypothetical protein